MITSFLHGAGFIGVQHNISKNTKSLFVMTIDEYDENNIKGEIAFTCNKMNREAFIGTFIGDEKTGELKFSTKEANYTLKYDRSLLEGTYIAKSGGENGKVLAIVDDLSVKFCRQYSRAILLENTFNSSPEILESILSEFKDKSGYKELKLKPLFVSVDKVFEIPDNEILTETIFACILVCDSKRGQVAIGYSFKMSEDTKEMSKEKFEFISLPEKPWKYADMCKTKISTFEDAMKKLKGIEK